LDIGHANLLVELNSTDELLAAFGKRLRHVHLHDNKGGASDLHLPLGAGSLETAHYIRSLQPVGYNRRMPVVPGLEVEFVPRGNPAGACASDESERRADAGIIPRAPWPADQDYTTVRGMEPLAARYELLVDNLLDLSHETYLHGGYIGTPEVADIGMMQTKSVTYTFTGSGPFAFACHAPGHFEAGMRGTIAIVS
jgi:plastocyanin